jgi:hypothetical protein
MPETFKQTDHRYGDEMERTVNNRDIKTAARSEYQGLHAIATANLVSAEALSVSSFLSAWWRCFRLRN